MIHTARKGDEEQEARILSRRGFLSFLVKGAAAAAVPAKTYFFFGGIYRPKTPSIVLPENYGLLMGSAGLVGAILLVSR